MSKEEILARIDLLNGEIAANEDENHFMEDEIDRLWVKYNDMEMNNE